MKPIVVKEIINASKSKVWDYYTLPEHITQWNFADPSWHCPTASNEMKIDGVYKARMEAKDGSFGFDFEAIYTDIQDQNSFTYTFGGRVCKVDFKTINEHTEVTVTFDPEEQNSIEMQQAGWQAILSNFKAYVESN